MEKKIGVYAGSFDPPTNGHVWMIEQGARFFDEFIVALGINPDKRYTFSVEERLDMLRVICSPHPTIRVTQFSNQFLVRYAQSVGASHLLRGIRDVQDYEFERGMRNINADLDRKIVTHFLMPPRELTEISSSLVKGLIGPEEWEQVIKAYVPQVVLETLLAKFHGDASLREHWFNLWKRLGARGDPLKWYGILLAKYLEPARHHHNLAHISHCLKELDDVRKDNLIPEPNFIELAIWFHDADYDPLAKDNEEQSWLLAREFLMAVELPIFFRMPLEGMILVTKHSEAPQSGAEKVLVDIDLSILGQPEAVFDEYERNIRKEYEMVPDDQFRAGRAKVLESFLDRPTIYSTECFQQRYEERARANLVRSLAKLR